MDNEELKRCPFCGGEAALVDLTEYDYYRFQVVCQKCGVSTLREHIKSIVIAYWNRRADDGR